MDDMEFSVLFPEGVSFNYSTKGTFYDDDSELLDENDTDCFFDSYDEEDY